MKPDKPERTVIFTTNGIEVPLRAVPEVLIRAASDRVARAFRKRAEPIDPPTYTVRLPGGSEEIHEHDEKSLVVTAADLRIEDPAAADAEAQRRTEENQAAWAAYIGARKRLDADQSKATGRAILELGIDLELPADDSWTARQRRADPEIEIPEEPDERRWYWLTSEVLITPDDLMKAIEGVTALTYQGAVKEEDVASMMATFRHRMEESADPALARAFRPVAVQRKDGGAAGGESLGADADRVPGSALPGPGGDGRPGTEPGTDAVERAGAAAGGEPASSPPAETESEQATSRTHAAA